MSMAPPSLPSVTAETASRRSVLLPSDPAPPAPLLTTQHNVDLWPSTPGFKGFWGWVQRRCDRIRGREIVTGPHDTASEGIQHLMRMLDSMMAWVKEVPPLPQENQRFGNLAFRKYIKLVEERLPPLLQSPPLPAALPGQLLPLFLNSHAFGHPTRLDYGTGHELAFVLGLWCCVVSGWIGGEDKEGEEDELVLRVFARYLDLTTLLQKTYRLEPAGSHGVWGLDDYCFLPYLFGSAQLLGGSFTPAESLSLALTPSPPATSTITSTNTTPTTPATPAATTAIASTAVSSAFANNNAPPVSPRITDLYTLSLHRLTTFKRGASFSEHSPLLYSLSQLPSWAKPHSGLRKMFIGEVVGKRVVVQGLWVGGWCWGGAEGAGGEGANVRGVGVEGSKVGKEDTGARGGKAGLHEGRSAVPPGGHETTPTPAPWTADAASDSRASVLEATRATWGTRR
ncbi:PPIase PTPA-1 [Saitozyma sp. JCM 24511]|nr:PPIase PTPA-1 [Saitozyma sp. JCM 24511]